MDNYTINTYEMKRDIVNFSKKICDGVSKQQSKFVMDMIYGISKSKNILLSSIAEALQEHIKKVHTIDRLSENLAVDLDENMNTFGNNPIFVIDNSDVIKPKGNKFEDLGLIVDGSSEKKNIEKGYQVCEVVGLTEKEKQPISVYSKVYSSTSKDHISANDETMKGLDRVISKLKERNQKGIFVNDRGYDSVEIMNYYYRKEQYFIIRLKENRKVYVKNKWYKISTIRDAKKGKVKLNIFFQNENKECYASVLKVQVTGKKRWMNLILVYGLGELPMMLASNIPIRSKEDLIKTVRCYIDRWRIEEYFKLKKQEYHFENFRVRSLKAINNLNKMLTYAIGLVGLLSTKMKKKEFVQKIIKESKSIKEKVYMWYYQISRGIYNILKMTKTGIRDWQEIRKQKEYDGQLSLL